MNIKENNYTDNNKNIDIDKENLAEDSKKVIEIISYMESFTSKLKQSVLTEINTSSNNIKIDLN